MNLLTGGSKFKLQILFLKLATCISFIPKFNNPFRAFSESRFSHCLKHSGVVEKKFLNHCLLDALRNILFNPADLILAYNTSIEARTSLKPGETAAKPEAGDSTHLVRGTSGKAAETSPAKRRRAG